ncbi:MAG: metallophosphoesterase [Roseburia sp.]|nr:metallophosphoesterase [Roseburia sp.]MCM1097647.1 metallophosphoesterase [Ruminococcus flavefaciens]
MNYYISDLHLFHEASIRFDNRPFSSLEEMHNTILASWNRTVTNGDTVYILGDLSMRGKNEELISLVARLKGKKILIKGNHDDISDYRYKQLFAEICDYKEIQDRADGNSYKLVLCHYPVFSWNKMAQAAILLYGHTHNSAEDFYFQQALHSMDAAQYFRHSDGQTVRAYNVGCMKEVIGYTPRSLQEIMDGYDRIAPENPQEIMGGYGGTAFKNPQEIMDGYDGTVSENPQDCEDADGDLLYRVSELIQDGLFYKFSDGDHAHGFEGVLEKILENPHASEIEGEKDQYSPQELRMIQKLHEKLTETTGQTPPSTP